MKLPFPFKSEETSPAISSWPWPTCGTPKTVSFRATPGNDVFKTMNSAYVDASAAVSESEESFSAAVEEEEEESMEIVIRGLRSERLFFEPGETSASILKEAAKMDDFPFKGSVAMAVDSRDPFVDFRESMEEMVEAHGLKDWECLEDLLTCYLRVNGKSNHDYIVGAFVDLLVSLATRTDHHHPPSGSGADDHRNRPPPPQCSASSITHSFTSPFSFSSGTTTSSSVSPSFSLLEVDDEVEKSSTVSTDNASSSSSNNVNIVPS